ncbi:MAG: 5-(carboxyamino)imidazole ribonucleotide synthase [Acidimicrobiales bacterium]|nr:5-(carboxyamino)imidazole ribonucleotide synthase [Acidimicrobiales bacterium]
MLALAGIPLGVRCVVLEPGADPPAGPVAEVVAAPYDDLDGLAALARRCEVVTYEFENVPVAAAEWLAERVPVRPGPLALGTAQDRLAEKRLFTALGIGTPPYVAVDDRAGLRPAVAEVGLPAVLKTRRLGYDGKGQVVLRAAGDVDAAWETLGGVPLLLEGFVAFDRELSIVAARGLGGEVAAFPVVANHHQGGILRLTLAPAPAPAPAPALHRGLQEQAEALVGRVLDALDYVGVIAVELFEVGGALLANELAPRVHNSGHWTIEGAETSQFEQHLRAVCGLPLGSAAARGWSAMVNLVGDEPDPAAVLAVPGAHLHRYGKAPRPGRKLAHVTVTAPDEATRDQRLADVLGACGLAPPAP